MNTADLLITNARVVSPPARPTAARGAEMSVLRIIPGATIAIRAGKIGAITTAGSPRPPAARTIDARDRVVVPAFVDCHTHLCWAGERLDEWEMKLRGVPYLDILARGGGIMSTVRAVRAATRPQLTELLLERLARCLAEGTTTVEIKSGYGLSTRDELKMLEAIGDAAASWPGTIVPTALLGHAIDPDVPDFAARSIGETLDEVHRCFPRAAVDVFIEKGAWSLEQGRSLLERAKSLGHPLRAHVDQFTSAGGVDLCIQLGAASADHLEASNDSTLATLAASGTLGVGLPICGLHLDNRYANLRSLIDAGGGACIATNCNPGSAPCFSMPMTIAAAARHCGLRFAEALTASTSNAAALLGLHDRAAISPGLRADLCILDTTDERTLAFNLGGRPVATVICGGTVYAA